MRKTEKVKNSREFIFLELGQDEAQCEVRVYDARDFYEPSSGRSDLTVFGVEIFIKGAKVASESALRAFGQSLPLSGSPYTNPSGRKIIVPLREWHYLKEDIIIGLCHYCGWAYMLKHQWHDDISLSYNFSRECAENLYVSTYEQEYIDLSEGSIDSSNLSRWIVENLTSMSERIIIPEGTVFFIDGKDHEALNNIIMSILPNGQFAIGTGEGEKSDGTFDYFAYLSEAHPLWAIYSLVINELDW